MMDDRYYMDRALALARKAAGRTSPNPMVGAVLVKNGKVVAEDYHRKAGTPHAEALVIDKAGDGARGAALYVSLEPCCHKEKRTPPCTGSIIGAGIRKVVVAMEDPNPRVSGKGISELRGAGIAVVTGVLEERARRLNEAYSKYITTGRPFVTLKVAMTLDGKIATPEGRSKWITGEKARRMVHGLRSSSDAILTAIGTVKADDPELTARVGGGKDPLRIVIDPNLETPDGSRILKTPPATILVARGPGYRTTSESRKGGAEIIYYEGELRLDWLLGELARRGITSVLVEGGSSLNSHMLDEGVVDKVMFFVAPKIIGGAASYPSVGGAVFRSLAEAHLISDMKVRRVGEDLLIEGYIRER